MIGVDQLVNKSVGGDCYRACIASILEVPAEAVPELTFEYAVENDTESRSDQRWMTWLEQFNLSLVRFYPSSFEVLPAGYGIATVHAIISRSGKRCCHCVVVKGKEVIFDPSPYREGGWIEKWLYAEFFTVIDPAKPIGRPSTTLG